MKSLGPGTLLPSGNDRAELSGDLEPIGNADRLTRPMQVLLHSLLDMESTKAQGAAPLSCVFA